MFFTHRIRKTDGMYDKGIEIHDSFDSAKQSYHANLGAYAYGHNEGTTFVSNMITDESGTVLMDETWIKAE